MYAVVLEVVFRYDAAVRRHIRDYHLTDASLVKHVRSFGGNRLQSAGVIRPDNGLTDRRGFASRQKYLRARRKHSQVFLIEADDVCEVAADREAALSVAYRGLDHSVDS